MISTAQYENLEPDEQAVVDDVIEGLIEQGQSMLDFVAPSDDESWTHETVDPDGPDIEF